MAFVKMGDLDKLGPEERKQFENLMTQFPHLRSKIEVSRELNTGTPPPQPSPPSYSTTPAIDSSDLPEGLEIDWDQLNAAPSSAATHLGTGRHGGESPYNQGSFQQEEEEKQVEQNRRRQEEQKQERAPTPEAKPVFKPEGKIHPVLSKIRTTLGMDGAEKTASIKVGDSTYKMKRLSREEIIKLTGYASMRSVSDAELRGNVEMSLVSFAVQEIDGVPMVNIFDVPLEEYSYVIKKNTAMAPQERRERASQAFFDLLKEAPNELTDTLLQFYEQEFPSLNLLDRNLTQALCPESGCNFKSLIGKEEKRFCPVHGKELFKEGDLPNPF